VVLKQRSINKPVTRQEMSIAALDRIVDFANAIVRIKDEITRTNKKNKKCIRIMTARWHVNARRPWLNHVKMMPVFYILVI